MIYKGVHFPGWKILKRKGEHNYYLSREVSPKSPYNFYLYPKASMFGGHLVVDRLHAELRYQRCTSSWHTRTFLDRHNFTECSWWKIEKRAPIEWRDFLESELDRILGCSCYPKLMGRGEGAPLQICSRDHLLSVDRARSMLVE